MRFSTIAIAASAAGSAAAQQSLCNKYTAALLKENTGANQYTLLTLLVNTAVIGNYTGKGSPNADLPGSLNEVPGILAPGMVDGSPVNLAKYFDGSLLSSNRGGQASSVNFLDGGGADPIIADPTSSGKMGSNQYILLTHLYSYFGVLLGCTEYGKDGFPAYAGSNSQGEVHQFMALDDAEVTYFIEQVGLAATSFGVTASDAMSAGKALTDAFGQRCSAPAEIVPDTGKEPQAICQADDCPLADNAQCSAYIPVMEPVAAGSGPAPTGGMPPTTTPTMPTTSPFPGAATKPTAAAGMMAAAGVLAAALL